MGPAPVEEGNPASAKADYPALVEEGNPASAKEDYPASGREDNLAGVKEQSTPACPTFVPITPWANVHIPRNDVRIVATNYRTNQSIPIASQDFSTCPQTIILRILVLVREGCTTG